MTSPDRISIRDQTLSLAANGKSFFDALHDLGVGAIELQIDPDFTTPHVRQAGGAPFSINADAGVARFRTTLAAEGVGVSALLLMTDFSSRQAADHVTWAVRAVRLAEELGAPVIRVDPLTREKELPGEIVRNNFIACIREVLEQTPHSTIDIGIENHGPFGNDPVFLDGILAAVGDSRLGLTLDIGNFYWWGVPLDELYRLLERYARRSKHTHVKNINYPPELANAVRPIGLDYEEYCCPLDAGNIDLRRVGGILNEAGYSRDFCIENESLHKFGDEQKLEVLRKDIAAVRKAFLEGPHRA